MKAMVLAAGLGTRLGDLTKERPKALVEVGGIPLIEHVIRRLVSFGFTTIVVNVHHFAQLLTDFLLENDFGARILISDESDELLDTGGGILHAQSLLGDKPFLVHNVDIFSDLDLKALYDYHINHNALATLAVAKRYSTRQLLFDDAMQLGGWVNKKTGEEIIVHKKDGQNEFAFSGIHVMSSAFFQKVNRKGSFPIIPTYLELCRVNSILGYDTTNQFLLDVGKVESIKEAERFLR